MQKRDKIKKIFGNQEKQKEFLLLLISSSLFLAF